MWEDGKEYNVVLGRSFHCEREWEHSPYSTSEYHTFRYEFKPASVDDAVEGTFESLEKEARVSYSLQKEDDVGGSNSINFKGILTETSSTDCILIFQPGENGSPGQFVIEKVSCSAQQLRMVRPDSGEGGGGDPGAKVAAGGTGAAAAAAPALLAGRGEGRLQAVLGRRRKQRQKEEKRKYAIIGDDLSHQPPSPFSEEELLREARALRELFDGQGRAVRLLPRRADDAAVRGLAAALEGQARREMEVPAPAAPGGKPAPASAASAPAAPASSTAPIPASVPSSAPSPAPAATSGPALAPAPTPTTAPDSALPLVPASMSPPASAPSPSLPAGAGAIGPADEPSSAATNTTDEKPSKLTEASVEELVVGSTKASETEKVTPLTEMIIITVYDDAFIKKISEMLDIPCTFRSFHKKNVQTALIRIACVLGHRNEKELSPSNTQPKKRQNVGAVKHGPGESKKKTKEQKKYSVEGEGAAYQNSEQNKNNAVIISGNPSLPSTKDKKKKAGTPKKKGPKTEKKTKKQEDGAGEGSADQNSDSNHNEMKKDIDKDEPSLVSTQQQRNKRAGRPKKGPQQSKKIKTKEEKGT